MTEPNHAKILTRPNGTAIFFIALFGAVAATLILFVAPLNGSSGDSPQAQAIQQAGAASRPASQPTSRPASQPVGQSQAPSAPQRAEAAQATASEAKNYPIEDYRALLNEYVHNGDVDYKGLQSRAAEKLTKLAKAIAQTDQATIDALSPAERTAWYINAYNILTLDLIVRHYPIASIMDIEKPWDTPLTVAGQPLTLNDIEHKILRLKDEPEEVRRAHVDPRLHFALNCASVGCPDLQSEPFTAANLSDLQDKAVRDFMADPSKFRIDGNTLHLSQLLDWYGNDFNLLYEESIETKQAIGRFFANYTASETEEALLKSGNFEIQWMDYDWALNEKK